MIRATYERRDGTRFTVTNDVRSCEDHLVSLSHSRRQQSGYRFVGCERVDDGGLATFTRDLPPEPKALPDSGDVPAKGVSVRSLKNRRVR